MSDEEIFIDRAVISGWRSGKSGVLPTYFAQSGEQSHVSAATNLGPHTRELGST